MNKLYITVLLIFLANLSSAQTTDVNWLNKNAYPLAAANETSLDDLEFLDKALAGNKILGLGEASHGTHEFYAQKKRIVQYAVENLGYKALGFEFPANMLEPIGKYVLTGEGDLTQLMADLKMIKTREIYDLFAWIAAYNKYIPATGKVRVFGFDKMENAGDPFTREINMTAQFNKMYDVTKEKSIVWGHNLHMAKDTTIAQFPAMGYHLRETYGADYFVIGFDTYKGSVNVLTDDELEPHTFVAADQILTDVFLTAKYPNYFIQVSDKSGPLYARRGGITNIYANWTEKRSLPVKLGIDFDAMIFLKETTASVPLH